ncbi:hypothetical protein ABT340_37995 [Streptosporangium sp. NPDC000239]|uniref:hypothetical protein n=1 Tax=Streptosporangium sp. NPDC000239 TaxID=3154248 RepID=UPI0033291ED9
MHPERVRARLDRSATTALRLGHEIGGWMRRGHDDRRLHRFTGHLDVLDGVLSRMLGAVVREIEAIDPRAASGEAYRRCGELDGAVFTIRRLFDWYAAKYDQRRDPVLAGILACADEVVLSCWRQPFEDLGREPPTGPLAYVEPRFDAFATPRVSVPPDLRLPADSLVAEFVGRLPVPVVCLPEWTAVQAWWLTLAAHEVGHHVHKDLDPGLENASRDALAEATGDERWRRWALESFADAYSVLMLGPAAAWIVEELGHGPPESLTRAHGGYPPLPVRLALMAEVARQAGLGGAGAPELAGAAGALLGLRAGGRTLVELSGLSPGWFAERGTVRAQARSLAGSDPFLPRLAEPYSARLLLAAAATVVDAGPAAPSALHANLLRHLPRCGPPGRLGVSPAGPPVARLAEELTGRLLGSTR